MQWRKMDDHAPLDETKVLLWVTYSYRGHMESRPVIGWFDKSSRRWVHGAELGPFYWMPLPLSPEVAPTFKQAVEIEMANAGKMISNMATG